MNTPAIESRQARTFGARLPGRRWATIAHYVSLGIAAAILVYLGRNQWFFFDEWSFLGHQETELWAGHGGHWSTIAVLVWMGLEAVFGLSSYTPFLGVAVVAHLVVAHLLWRIMRRLDVAPWISTAATAVFLLLGSASENLLWAFQYGYMGAIAFALGAVLLAMRGPVTAWSGIWIAVLLVLGCATSGTALPFFVTVALVLWHVSGFMKACTVLVGPALVYGLWFFALAGPNPNEGLRARGSEILLTPQYAGSMIVDGIGTAVPIPFVGVAVLAAIAGFTLRALNRRPSVAEVTALSLFAGGVVFAFLTAYSRWGTGLATTTAGRYVYVVAVTSVPLLALVISRVSRSRMMRLIALIAIAVVGVYNVGLLVTDAREEAGRENFVRQAISAGIELATQHPDGVDLAASPEPQYFPFPLGLALELEKDGLATIPFSEEARLTALVGVGTVVEDIDTVTSCATAGPGSTISSGESIRTSAASDLSIAAVKNGLSGHARQIQVAAGVHRIRTADDTPVVIQTSSTPFEICTEGSS